MKTKTVLLIAFFVILLPLLSYAQTTRYYISDILPPVNPATCTNPDLECKLFYRLALHDANPRPSFSAIIPTSPTTGIPLFSFGLAYVKCRVDDCLAADLDGRNFRLFQGAEGFHTTFDSIMIGIDTTIWGDVVGVKTAIKNKLESLGIATIDITSVVSLRYILQKVVRHLSPGSNELNLRVGD